MITTRAPDGANKIIIKHHNDHDIFSCPIHKENHLWYCKLGSSPLLLTSLVIVQVAQKKRKSIAAAVCTDGEKHQKPNINLLKPVQPFSFESGPGSVSVIPWRRCFSAKMFQLQTIISTMVLVPYLASTQKYSKWHFHQYIWSPINQSSQGPKSIVKIRFCDQKVFEKNWRFYLLSALVMYFTALHHWTLNFHWCEDGSWVVLVSFQTHSHTQTFM